jgi:hypothetical protein
MMRDFRDKGNKKKFYIFFFVVSIDHFVIEKVASGFLCAILQLCI